MPNKLIKRGFIKWLFFIFLLLAYHLANAIDFEAEKRLFDVVNMRAIEAKSPAIVTAAAAERIKDNQVKDASIPSLKWSRLEGVEIAHLSIENTEKLKELAKNNEEVMQGAMDIEKLVFQDLELYAMGLTATGVESVLSDTCAVCIDWHVIGHPRITMSSGGGISIKEVCRLYAWVLAANGIRFVKGKYDTNTIVLEND